MVTDFDLRRRAVTDFAELVELVTDFDVSAGTSLGRDVDFCDGFDFCDGICSALVADFDVSAELLAPAELLLAVAGVELVELVAGVELVELVELVAADGYNFLSSARVIMIEVPNFPRPMRLTTWRHVGPHSSASFRVVGNVFPQTLHVPLKTRRARYALVAPMWSVPSGECWAIRHRILPRRIV